MKIAIISSSFYGFYEQALIQNALTQIDYFKQFNFGITKQRLQNYNLNNIIAPLQTCVKNGFHRNIIEEFTNGSVNNINSLYSQITVVMVAGAIEIPQAFQWIAQTDTFDGVITLGCIVKGKTSHFDHVSNEAISGVANVALKYNIPTANGIITAFTEEDVIERIAVWQKYWREGNSCT